MVGRLRAIPAPSVVRVRERTVQPTRSAITVAGISGNSTSNDRTRSSNGPNDVTVAARTYFGGPDEATTFTTVVREIPNRSAICFFGTPCAARLRINAQSSTVITLQSSSVHFSSVATDQFSSVVDTNPTITPNGPIAYLTEGAQFGTAAAGTSTIAAVDPTTGKTLWRMDVQPSLLAWTDSGFALVDATQQPTLSYYGS